MKKKKIINNIIKKNYKKMDLRISLLNFNFAMIYIIHKILVLIKNHMNYLKCNIFKCIFKKTFIFFKKIFFFIIYNDGKSKV